MTTTLPHWDAWSDAGQELLLHLDRTSGTAYLWCPRSERSLWVGRICSDAQTPLWAADWGWRRATVAELEALLEAVCEVDLADWEWDYLDRAAERNGRYHGAVSPATAAVLAGGEPTHEYLCELLEVLQLDRQTCPTCQRTHALVLDGFRECAACAAPQLQAVS